MAQTESARDGLISVVSRIAGLPARQYRWTSLSNAAKTAVRARRYQEAAEHLEEALAIAESAWPDGPKFTATAVRFANLCVLLGRLAQAEQLYRRALIARGAAPDQIDDLFVQGVSGLGRVYLLKGDLDKADLLLRRALDLETKLHGPGFAAAPVLFNLAMLHASNKRDADSKRLFSEAIETLERNQSADEVEAIAVYDNCALFCISRDMPDEAEPLLRRALIVRQETVGPRHPIYAAGLVNLGRLQFARDAFDEAESLFWQATDVYQRARRSSFSGFLPALYFLALIAVRNKRYDEAESLCKKILAATESDAIAGIPAEAAVLHVLGLLRIDRNKPAEAEPMLRRAHELARDSAVSHRRFAGDVLRRLLDDLAGLLGATGKSAEAERLSSHAGEIRGEVDWSVGRRVFTAG